MSKIVLENFNDGNGYYKVNLAYLSKEQVEEIENLVSKWKPNDEDIKSCIGMCLTDANEQRFKDYGTNLKDCLAWLEKQGEQKSKNESTDTCDSLIIKSKEFPASEKRDFGYFSKPADKIEPKFKVGDVIRHKEQGFTCKIIAINTEYILSGCNGNHLPFDWQDDYELIKQSPVWSKEDENNILFLTSIIEECFKDKEKITLNSDTVCANFTKEDVIDRLKSLKDRYIWKPSDDMLEALYRVIPKNVMEKSEDEVLLDKLYQGLKYGKILSEK